MNTKGSLGAAIFMIASIAGFAIFLLVIGYAGNEVGTKMENQLNDSTEDHFVTSINTSLQKTIMVSTTMLGSLWYIAFGGLMLGVLISAWFTRTHPIMLPVFFILLVVTIIVGVAMSNAYEEIAANATLSTAAAQQGAVGFMMAKLPYLGLIIGLLAILVMFIKPKEAQTSVM